MVFLGEKEMVAGNSRSCYSITSSSSAIKEGIEAHKGIEAPLVITLFLPALNPFLVQLREGVKERC